MERRAAHRVRVPGALWTGNGCSIRPAMAAPAYLDLGLPRLLCGAGGMPPPVSCGPPPARGVRRAGTEAARRGRVAGNVGAGTASDLRISEGAGGPVTPGNGEWP